MMTKWYIGIDEVGRGPLAGPVTLGIIAVKKEHLTHFKKYLKGITDSKQLSEREREAYYTKIQALKKEGYCKTLTTSISASRIDTKGISWALETGVRRGLHRLGILPKTTFVSLDGGLKAPHMYPQETIIKGDVHHILISTASVYAKVTRDRKMVKYSKQYPAYGFERHKGYGTKAHYRAIQKYGLTPLHRATWIN